MGISGSPRPTSWKLHDCLARVDAIDGERRDETLLLQSNKDFLRFRRQNRAAVKAMDDPHDFEAPAFGFLHHFGDPSSRFVAGVAVKIERHERGGGKVSGDVLHAAAVGLMLLLRTRFASLPLLVSFGAFVSHGWG